MKLKALLLMAEDVYTSLLFIVLAVMYSIVCLFGWIAVIVGEEGHLWWLWPSVPLWLCWAAFRVKDWYVDAVKRTGEE